MCQCEARRILVIVTSQIPATNNNAGERRSVSEVHVPQNPTMCEAKKPNVFSIKAKKLIVIVIKAVGAWVVKFKIKL